jgi:molecular chaperone GrpE (heat shock protein)
MSNVYAVRDSKGRHIDYSKKKTISKKNNISNLEKKFEILNKKMKQVKMDYKNLQKELKKKTKK